MSKLSLALFLALAGTTFADVKREGAGERRTKLDAMELAPFPSELWGSLTDWSGGAMLTEADTAGSVVVVVSWAGWYPTSVKAMSTVQQVVARHADKGVVAVGVHHPEGWEGSAAAAAQKGVTFRMAHDAAGRFRDRLLVDQDPDIYLIDRAGQLRYADIETASLEEAVAELAAESREDAAATKARLAREARDARTAAMRTESIEQNVRMVSIPNALALGYQAPPEEAYNSDRWPKIDEAVRAFMSANRQPGQKEPVYKVVMPREAAWFPAEPEFDGRMLIVYPWNPEIRQSWAIVGDMDRLQRALGRDAVVVGALFPLSRLQGAPQNTGQQQSEEDAARELKTLQEAFQGFAQNRKLDHTVVADLQAAFLATFNDRSDVVIPVPGALVFSSDGTLRWYGWTTSPGFQASIDRILELDPGIRQRRELEAKHLEGQR